MPNEIQVLRPDYSGATVYATIVGPDGRWWNVSTARYENALAGDWPAYAIALTEAAGTGFFEGSIPIGVPLGVLSVTAFVKEGATPSPNDLIIAEGEILWSGTVVVGSGENAADLLEAIQGQFITSSVAQSVPGGIFLNVAGKSAPRPYITIEETGASLKLITSTTTIHDTRIRLRIYAPNDDGTGAAGVTLGDQVEDLFTGAALTFNNGWTTPWVRGDRKHQVDRELSRGGQEVWFLAIEFTTRVKR